MNKMKKFISKNVSIISAVLVVMLMFGISIGYSVLSASVNISNISSEVRIVEDVRIIGLTQESFSGNAAVEYSDFTKDKLYFKFTLPDLSSSVKYKVKITNVQETEMAIFAINGMPEGLTYSLEGYTEKEKICNTEGKCNLGIDKEFYINFTPNSTITDFDFNLNVVFKPIYDVSYSGFANSDSYPKTVFLGDTIEFNFEPNPNVKIDIVHGGVVQDLEDVQFDNTIGYFKFINTIEGDFEIKLSQVLDDADPLNNVLGDVNEDGVITVDDLNLLIAYLDGSQTEFSSQALVNMDLNEDDVIDENDKTLLEDIVNNVTE